MAFNSHRMNTGNYQSEEKKMKLKKKGFFVIFLITSFVLLLAFCILFFLRYEAWVGNIPEPPYTPPQAIDRITLTPGEDFMKERTISWRNDTIQQEARVEYYRSDSTDTNPGLISIPALSKNVFTRAGHAYYYHARLTGLEKGAVYNYRIVAGNDTTRWMNFNMPSATDTIRFIYMGDVQDEHGQVSDSLFNLLRTRESGYDFLAFGGDQIERPIDRYWSIWYNSIQGWADSVPLVAVPGNHEYLKGINYQLDTRWIAQHNYPENGPKHFKGKSYFIDFPLMRMIIMDSNTIQWPGTVALHYNWLEKTLQETTQPWTVVMFHHGVYTVREGRMHPIMLHLFLPLLEKHGTDLVLQGHDHAYSRITTKANGDTIPPVYVISNASPKFYRNGFDPIHDRLGSGIALYQKIRITRNELAYQSLFFDGEVYDDLLIKQTPEGRKKVTDNARGWKEEFRYNEFANSKKGEEKKKMYLQKIKEREANP